MPVVAVADQVGGAGRLGGDHRQAAGHGFERDVAERLGDRRVEEHVGAGERAREVVAGLLADEDRVGQLLLEPRPRRAFADDQHAVLMPRSIEGVDRVGEDVEALLHHQPAEEDDDHLIVAECRSSGAIPCRAARD